MHGLQAAQPQGAHAGGGQFLLAPVGTGLAQRVRRGTGGQLPHLPVAQLLRLQQHEPLFAQAHGQAALAHAWPVGQHGRAAGRMLHEVFAQLGQLRLHPRRHLPRPRSPHLFRAHARASASSVRI
jgi:hypothetical protein